MLNTSFSLKILPKICYDLVLGCYNKVNKNIFFSSLVLFYLIEMHSQKFGHAENVHFQSIPWCFIFVKKKVYKFISV